MVILSGNTGVVTTLRLPGIRLAQVKEFLLLPANLASIRLLVPSSSIGGKKTLDELELHFTEVRNVEMELHADPWAEIVEEPEILDERDGFTTIRLQFDSGFLVIEARNVHHQVVDSIPRGSCCE